MSRVSSHDQIFKALADGRRRRMLDLLNEQPRTTSQVCKEFKTLDRCTVMQHLSVLEKAGLVIVKKEGKYRWNYIDVVPIREIYDRWINRYASHSAGVLADLKHDMEL